METKKIFIFNTRNRNLFVILCLFNLITGCYISTSIQSATSDKVVIRTQPERFTNAFVMAKEECQKYTKNADYILDGTASLEAVAFNCVEPEAEEVSSQ